MLAKQWRIIIMLLDNIMTTLQVKGTPGLSALAKLVQQEGISVLYNEALASLVAIFVGHYPWFLNSKFLSSTSQPTALTLSNMDEQYT
ncbi:hypothetical protein EON65_57000 [archaeon]|nr:MAG: hypothetical protein EON65_57000 [archaeon]